ncbi:hypothetical protein ACJJTC_003120 [Scirpophaga incertulas]
MILNLKEAEDEQCIESILRAEKAAESTQTTEDSSSSSQQHTQLKNLYKAGLTAAEQEERLLRTALSRIYEIRSIKNERRMQARHAGNKETIGCGALMKLLLSAAQTLPLHVGAAGERAPPLCGAVPPDAGHVARPGDAVAALVRVSDKEENWILAEVALRCNYACRPTRATWRAPATPWPRSCASPTRRRTGSWRR